MRPKPDASEALPVRRKKHKKKPDTIELVACFVHGGEAVDSRLRVPHHLVPLGYGGQDVPENIQWVCGACHDHVHRLAFLIAKGQVGVAQDLAVQEFPTTPSIRGRLMELANIVAKAFKTRQATGEEDEQNEVVVLQLHLPKALHRRLKTLAASHTHQKSGRKVGLYRYCLTVLQNHCRVAELETIAEQNPQRLYRYAPQPETSSPDNSTNPFLIDL